MTDLVALIVGIACYPKLEGRWNVPDDRTAKDAIAVTRELVARGVDPNKIKLLLSAQAELPADVAGVVPERAHKDVLERFIGEELDRPPFVGSRFLLFCSGHGVAAEGQQETLIITADSYRALPNKRVFRCLGIEQLRSQLQGMDFEQQLFCINACRTPAEWTITGNDQVERVATIALHRRDGNVQARFFPNVEFKPTPVVESQTVFSNGFAEAIAKSIRSCEWPPRAIEWALLLHKEWPATEALGIPGFDRIVFKRLYGAIHNIDRHRQSKLATGAFQRARTWTEREKEHLWRSTLVDLHACTADRLDVLMRHLEMTVFTDQLVPGGVQRVDRWPRRGQDLQRRKKQLIEELTYCLVEDRSLQDAGRIIETVADFAPGVGVVSVEVEGPCDAGDGELIESMLSFWKRIIAAAVERGTRIPCLPLLLVGHVDPELRAEAASPIDTTCFYHASVLEESHERRLGLVRGYHLSRWLDGIVPPDDHRRIELEWVLAHSLGSKLLEDVTVRMGRILDVVDARVS